MVRKVAKWTATVFTLTTMTVNGHTNKEKKPIMKKMTASATLLFISLLHKADDVKQPYTIQRGEEIIVIINMPKFSASEPISNSFVYIDGEYVPFPYVVSVTNLSVFINGRLARNYERMVHTHEFYQRQSAMGRRVSMIMPETVGKLVDDSAERFVESLQRGVVDHIIGGSPRIGSALGNGDGGALALIDQARKAVKGDEKAKQELTKAMGLENSLSRVPPDWIEKLANNTKLETRATAIIEAKRERERQERERREQQNR